MLEEWLEVCKHFGGLLFLEIYSLPSVQLTYLAHMIGIKVICQGILFKIAVDKHGMYGSDANASKAAGHEFKSTTSFFDLQLPDVQLPLMAIIDYRGFRVTAMSLLPISGHDTLVYGSSDGGKTVMASYPDFNQLMERAGKLLNLKPHLCGREDPKLLVMPVDVEGHVTLKFRTKKQETTSSITDISTSSPTSSPSQYTSSPSLEKEPYKRSYVVLDLARLFPPQMPLAPPEKGSRHRSYLYELLRPEYVKTNPVPLSSDAFSPFNQTDPNAKINNEEVAAACHRLITTRIPQFAAFLEKGSLSGLTPAAELDCSRFVSLMHRQGINIRFLAVVRRCLQNPKIRRIALTEMVSRIIKDQLNEELRNTTETVQLPVEEPYRETVVGYLNKLFGTDADSFWKSNLIPALLKKFNAKTLDLDPSKDAIYADQPTMETTTTTTTTTTSSKLKRSRPAQENSEPNLRHFVDPMTLWDRVSTLTGVTLRLDSLRVMTSGLGISSTDIKDLRSRVRVTDVVNRALAISVSMDAKTKRGTEAYRLYTRAHQLFNDCLEVSASNSATFYHWGVMLHDMAQHDYFSKTQNSLKVLKLGALPKLAQAVHLNPAHLDANAELAWTLLDFLLHHTRFETMNSKTTTNVALKDTTAILERAGHHLAISIGYINPKVTSVATTTTTTTTTPLSVSSTPFAIKSLTSSSDTESKHNATSSASKKRVKTSKKSKKEVPAQSNDEEPAPHANDDFQLRFASVKARIESASNSMFMALAYALWDYPDLHMVVLASGTELFELDLQDASFMPKFAFILISQVCPNLTLLRLRNAVFLDSITASEMLCSKSEEEILPSPIPSALPVVAAPTNVKSSSKSSKIKSSSHRAITDSTPTTKILPTLPHLKTLDLICCDHLTDIDDFEKMYWPDLEILTFSKCGMSDGFYASRLNARQLPSLTQLSICGSMIHDDSVTKICTQFGNQLKMLNLSICLNLQYASCFNLMVQSPILAGLKSLTHLELSGCRSLTAASMSAFIKALSSSSSSSSSHSKTGSLVSVLSKSHSVAPSPPSSLTFLNLDGCSSISEDIWNSIIKKVPFLTSLSMEKSSATGNTLQLIGSLCPRLERLHAPACKGMEPLSLLKVLQGCPNLKYLDGSFWMWNKTELAPKLAKSWTAAAIPTKLALEQLFICAWSLDTHALQILFSCCPKLMNLDISNCMALGPDIFNTVATHCTNLEKIVANGFVLTDDAVEALTNGCKTLRVVSFIRAHELTDASLVSLSRLTLLNRLNLSHSPFITNEAIQMVVTACPTLKRLGLKGSKLVTAEFLFDKLRHTCTELRIEVDVSKTIPWGFQLP
jgi:hypothetical protein